MKTINYTNGMELNMVGATYVANGVAIDCTEHYLSKASVLGFGKGEEVSKEEAMKLLLGN